MNQNQLVLITIGILAVGFICAWYFIFPYNKRRGQKRIAMINKFSTLLKTKGFSTISKEEAIGVFHQAIPDPENDGRVHETVRFESGKKVDIKNLLFADFPKETGEMVRGGWSTFRAGWKTMLKSHQITILYVFSAKEALVTNLMSAGYSPDLVSGESLLFHIDWPKYSGPAIKINIIDSGVSESVAFGTFPHRLKSPDVVNKVLSAYSISSGQLYDILPGPLLDWIIKKRPPVTIYVSKGSLVIGLTRVTLSGLNDILRVGEEAILVIDQADNV